MTYSIYDPKLRTVTMANSGLPYPLLVRGGDSRFLEVGGIPLGLFPESQYQEIQLQLQAGDVLVLHSDGVIESRNDAGEDFGLKRLAEVVRVNHEKSAEEIVKAVTSSLAHFIGRMRPQDDRTMIVVKMDKK